MTPEDFRLQFEYNGWANRRLLDAAAALTLEQFTRDLGSSFPSVRDTLVHIMGAEWFWAEHFRGRPAAMLAAEDFPDLAAVRARWATTDRELQSFIGGLTPEAIAGNIEYRNLKGKAFTSPLWQVLHQLMHHGTYHRGQVSAMLRQLAAKSVGTDILLFYAQRVAGSA